MTPTFPYEQYTVRDLDLTDDVLAKFEERCSTDPRVSGALRVLPDRTKGTLGVRFSVIADSAPEAEHLGDGVFRDALKHADPQPRLGPNHGSLSWT